MRRWQRMRPDLNPVRRSAMQRERLLSGIAVTTVLALSLVGCASGKLRLDLAKSCQAHGGTWAQAQETCTMSTAGAGGAAKRARESCGGERGGAPLPRGPPLVGGAKKHPPPPAPLARAPRPIPAGGIKEILARDASR